MKYSFSRRAPASPTSAAPSRISSSLTPLLIACRIRSEPASGATVTVFVPPSASAFRTSGRRLSMRSDETETRAPSAEAPTTSSGRSGWSETAAPSSPTRSVCSSECSTMASRSSSGR